MGDQRTVVFTDLHGSTAVFESLGNARATEVVTGYNAFISRSVVARGGQVIKTLGDGVLAIFSDPHSALLMVVELQREHTNRLNLFPVECRLPLRIGVAAGDLEWVDGDCYGDAVNVASRLCDLCGPQQIWVNDVVAAHAQLHEGIGTQSLGAISVRGKQNPCAVFQVEWASSPEHSSELMTVLGAEGVTDPSGKQDALGKTISLTFTADGVSDTQLYQAFDLPLTLGRVRANNIVLADPRVSRTHSKLLWKNGSVVLEDVSSYGTWVQFDGSADAALLRRESCVLHGSGVIGCGCSLSDATCPAVRFMVK